MKTMFLTVLLLGSAWTFAQNGDSSNVPVRKNQLFTNLLPVLIPAFGAVPEQFAFRLGYERSLKKNWALRFVPSVIIKNANVSDYFDYNVLTYTDSLMMREYSNYWTMPEYRLGIGIRKSFPRKHLIWYTGLDLYAAFSENKMQSRASLWKLDSTATAITGEDVWLPTNDPPAITRLAESRNLDLGISPFFGAEIPLRKRFSFSLQTGFDLFWRDTFFKRIYPVQEEFHWSSANFNVSGLVSEVALRFRF